MTQEQIKHNAQKVMAEIRRRQEVFRKVIAPTSVTGKQVLIVDDGLASGYTMVAAIRSMRKRGAEAVVAAVPVSSASGWKLVRNEADEVVCPIVSSTYPFAVASFYEQWSDLTDKEVIESLDTFKKQPEAVVNRITPPQAAGYPVPSKRGQVVLTCVTLYSFLLYPALSHILILYLRHQIC